MYKTIQSERLYEQIVEQIEQRILSGELKIGDQLPTERELAEQFGVSRTAVREAMKALAQNGLIQVKPGRGTFVTYGTSRAVRHSLGLTMKIEQAGSGVYLTEIREILEPEIAALAAARVTEDQISALRDAVAAMDNAMHDVEAFVDSDQDFHLTLAEATQNPLIPILLDPIVDLLQEQRKRITVPYGLEHGQYHHKRILDAVIRRDPEAAREAMRAHLRQVREDIEASLAMAS